MIKVNKPKTPRDVTTIISKNSKGRTIELWQYPECVMIEVDGDNNKCIELSRRDANRLARFILFGKGMGQ